MKRTIRAAAVGLALGWVVDAAAAPAAAAGEPAVAAPAAVAARDEIIALPDGTRAVVAVPAGFEAVQRRDAAGVTAVELEAPHRRVTLSVVFLPDDGEAPANARTRRERMFEFFREFVEASTEKAMRFEELEPRAGAGTFCVFTDARLAGKAPYPPGEYLHVTAGVKAWGGTLAVFKCFHNDTTSPDYLAVMRLLRESVGEKAGPLK